MEQQDWIEAVVQIAKIIIPIVVALLAPLAKRAVESLNAAAQARLGTERYAFCVNAARWVVEAAEQKADLETNEAKKAFALAVLTALCQEYEVPMSAEQLDALIEAAVKGMNDGRDGVGLPRFQIGSSLAEGEGVG